jgi:hypothetical protein
MMKFHFLAKTCLIALLFNGSAHAQFIQSNPYGQNSYQGYNQGQQYQTGGSSGITNLNNPITNHSAQGGSQSSGTFGSNVIPTPSYEDCNASANNLPSIAGTALNSLSGNNGLGSLAGNIPGGLTASSLNNLAMGSNNSNVASLVNPGQNSQSANGSTGLASQKNKNCPQTANTPGLMIGDVIFGKAVPVDGLVFKVNGKTVKLSGVDSPMKNDVCPNGYLNWKCGELVHNRLEVILENKPLRCTIQSVNTNEPVGVTCTMGLDNFSKTLLIYGLAYTTDPTDKQYMQQAKLDLRGMWAQGTPDKTVAFLTRH